MANISLMSPTKRMAATAIEKDIIAQHHESVDSLDSLDKVTPEALGDSLPKHYYKSPQFIASFIVRVKSALKIREIGMDIDSGAYSPWPSHTRVHSSDMLWQPM